MLPALRAAIKVAGSMRALAYLIGVTHAAVAQWDCVPAKRVIDVERATGIPREQLRPDLYRHTRIDEAIAFIKAAGYRVSKPRTSKRPKPKDRVDPTFVAKFADGTVTRMSTFTSLEKLDWKRGERLSQAAYQSRWRARERTQHFKQTGKRCLVDPIAPVPPAIISARFEQDGKVLAQRNNENVT